MNIFGTNELNRLVMSLKRSPAFVLNTFFNQVETSDSETVYFDVEKDGKKRRLAPFVHPLVEGKVVESRGYATKSFRPAYIKDKRVFDSQRPFKRVAGETIGSGQNLSPSQRLELLVRMDTVDQIEMLTRRMEVMCVEALLTGKETVNMLMPDGQENEVVLDFERANSQTIVLTGGDRWGQSGVEPIETLEDAALNTLQTSGSSIRSLIFDPVAWKSFRKNSALLEKKLDMRRVVSGQINIGGLPEHVSYKGNDGTFDYWVYADWYLESASDVNETKMIPSGTVIGVGDIDGVRHFGAIKDEEAGFQSLEYFSKSWVNKDPSVRFLLMQSAPIMVPYRINASFAMTIDGGA